MINKLNLRSEQNEQKINKLIKNQSNLKNNIENCAKSINTLLQSTNQIESEIITLQTSLESALLDNSEIQDDIDDLSSTLSTLQTEITTAQDSISNIQENLTTINNNIGTLEDDIGTLEDDIDAIKDDIEALEDDIETLENDIDAIKDDIETLEDDIYNITSEQTQQAEQINTLEETVDTLTDDINECSEDISSLQEIINEHGSSIISINQSISQINENIDPANINKSCFENYFINPLCATVQYCDPRPIYFICEPNSRIKIKVKFQIFSSIETNMTITVSINSDVIFTQTRDVEVETIDYEFETDYLTATKNNKLLFYVSNTYETTSLSAETSFRNIMVELLAPNVFIITRNNDFWAVPANNKIIMSYSTLYKDKTYVSMQLADENLSLEESKFFPFVCNVSYIRDFNDHTPYASYRFVSGVINHFDQINILYRHYMTSLRWVAAGNVSSDSNPTSQSYFNNYWLVRPTTNNHSTYNMAYISQSSNTTVKFMNSSNSVAYTFEHNVPVAELTGIIRRTNTTNSCVTGGIITDVYGNNTMFLFESPPSLTSKYEIPLGFGSQINAYNETDRIEVYISDYYKVRKITLMENETTNKFEITSVDYILGIQEYIKGPNQTYFLRKNKQILYYPSAEATTPTATFKVY